jgi:hypothetical protein
MGGTLYCNIVSYVESSKGHGNPVTSASSPWKISDWKMEFSTDNAPGSEGKSCLMVDSAKSSKLD